MSEEKKDLGDKAEDAFEKAKEKASEIGDKANEKFEEAKDAASGFAEEAKKTANEFTESAKEAFQGESKKLMAGILAIILGSLGIHKFILGYQKEGFILLGASIVGYATLCVVIGSFILMATGLVGLIEGIIYLTKSDEEFYNTYQAGQKPWF